MTEKGKSNLKSAIEGLRQHKAPDIWRAIAKHLQNFDESGQENLKKAAGSLRGINAPDVWPEIEKTLDRGSEKPITLWKRLSWVAVASVIVLLGYLWITILQPAKVNEMISYSTEEVPFFNAQEELKGLNTNDDQVLDYIQGHCQALAVKCQNPHFETLIETYLELNRAKEELEVQLNLVANQEQVIKFLIKIEKEKTEVGKEMLRMLRYS